MNIPSFDEFIFPISREQKDKLGSLIRECYGSNYSLSFSGEILSASKDINPFYGMGDYDKFSSQIKPLIPLGNNFKDAKLFLERKLKLERLINERIL